MDLKKFMNRDFLVKAGIVAGVFILLAVAVILIVTAGGKSDNNTIDTEKIIAYPLSYEEVTLPVATATLKGFAGDKVILVLNGTTVLLQAGDMVGDIMVKSFDSAAATVTLSFPGASTPDQELSFAAPSCSFER